MSRSLVNSDLTLFSYEILGLVGRGGAGAHDLLRMAKRGRILAWAGESQYYVEPKRLAKLGYLEARKEPGKTRERTVYTLTDRGKRALADYARTPVTVTPVKSETLLRLLICDLVGEDVTRDSLATLRGDIADLRQRLADSEGTARDLPHRKKYLLLAIGFLRGLLDLHEQLVDEVEREFSGPRKASSPASSKADRCGRRTRGGRATPGDRAVTGTNQASSPISVTATEA
jgi:DNA-binding PadR family transcriptional regulator